MGIHIDVLPDKSTSKTRTRNIYYRRTSTQVTTKKHSYKPRPTSPTTNITKDRSQTKRRSNQQTRKTPPDTSTQTTQNITTPTPIKQQRSEIFLQKKLEMSK